jgi:hypothetical protein
MNRSDLGSRIGAWFKPLQMHQLGRQDQHHRRFGKTAMDVRFWNLGRASCELKGMYSTAIERELGLQLVQQIFQRAPIATVSIDEQEVARRERTHKLARHLLEQCDEYLDAQ